MRLFQSALAAVLACSAAGAAHGQGLLTTKAIPSRLAFEAAQAAIDACAGRGFRVSASVVTHDGAIKLMLTGDGAGPVATITSRMKAYTAGTIGMTTGQLGASVAKLPGGAFPPIDAQYNIMTYAGGVPIVVAGKVLGGLGVGGSDKPDVDEACANAGLAKISSRLLADAGAP